MLFIGKIISLFINPKIQSAEINSKFHIQAEPSDQPGKCADALIDTYWMGDSKGSFVSDFFFMGTTNISRYDEYFLNSSLH